MKNYIFIFFIFIASFLVIKQLLTGETDRNRDSVATVKSLAQELNTDPTLRNTFIAPEPIQAKTTPLFQTSPPTRAPATEVQKIAIDQLLFLDWNEAGMSQLKIEFKERPEQTIQLFNDFLNSDRVRDYNDEYINLMDYLIHLSGEEKNEVLLSLANTQLDKRASHLNELSPEKAAQLMSWKKFLELGERWLSQN